MKYMIVLLLALFSTLKDRARNRSFYAGSGKAD